MRGLVVVCVVGLLGGACAAPTTDPESEVEFGLGGKADEGACDPAADLCWTTADTEAMRLVNRVEGDLFLGEGHAPTAMGTILDVTSELDHKLTDAERVDLERIREEVATMSPDAGDDEVTAAYQDFSAAVLTRLRGTFYAAHLVPLGRSADRQLRGSADDGADGRDAEETTDQSTYSPGMRESLQLLREAGVLGKAHAWMLEFSGVLDRDYAVLNAQSFGHWDAVNHRIIPTGLSREERVDRIIRDYKRAAGVVGLVAGGESLIPVAGIALSIATETYKLFELHARMAFEIAAVYGWDIREGRNLFTVSMMMMSYGMLAEAGDVLASNVVLPLLASFLARRLGATLPSDLASQLARRSMSQLLSFFTQRSQQVLAQTAIREGAEGVGRQILGYATVGLAVLASGAADYIITGWVGRHIETVAKKWVTDMMMEGTSFLSRPNVRECAFDALGAVAWADGAVTEREKNLFMAFLAKPYRSDESSWYYLTPTERRRLSSELRAARDTSPDRAVGCLGDELQSSAPNHRMSILAHVYAMMHIDLEGSWTEQQVYDDMRDELDGAGWFDGSEIDPEQLDYVERSVYLVMHPGTVQVAREYQDTVESILPEDSLPFLAEPSVEVAADFACGFDGNC